MDSPEKVLDEWQANGYLRFRVVARAGVISLFVDKGFGWEQAAPQEYAISLLSRISTKD